MPSRSQKTRRRPAMLGVLGAVVLAGIGMACLWAPWTSKEPTLTSAELITSQAYGTSSQSDSAGSGNGDSPASSGSVAKMLYGWQLTPSNIGLAPFKLSCSHLPVLQVKWSGHRVPAGTTIYRKRITTWLDLSNGNITIDQSCIQPMQGDVGLGSSVISTWGNGKMDGPVKVEDSECNGSLLTREYAAWVGCMSGAISVYRTYVHHFGSGLNTYGSYEKTGANVVIENNYVSDLVACGNPGVGDGSPSSNCNDPNAKGNHQSAYTARDFEISANAHRQLIVENNHFSGFSTNMSGIVFLQPNDSTIHNMTISGNYITGENTYLIYVDLQPQYFGSATYSNLRFYNNRLVHTGTEGLDFVRPSVPAFAEWKDNYKVYALGAKKKLIPNPNP